MGVKDTLTTQVNELSALSQENAASSQETTASASVAREQMEDLKVIADGIRDISSELVDKVGFFKA